MCLVLMNYLKDTNAAFFPTIWKGKTDLEIDMFLPAATLPN